MPPSATIHTLAFLLLAQILPGQTFTELPQSPPLRGVRFNEVAFSDVNGDGNQDVFITGQDSTNAGISKLYLNDGSGNFTEKTDSSFIGLVGSAAAFSDVNNDGYPDLLITGAESFSTTNRFAKLYLNDGLGNFSERQNIPFEGVWFGTVNFADVNNDGYEDVLITGQDSANLRLTRLYANDSLGNFTELTGNPFADVRFSSVAFADVNSDGYKDVLITGQDSLLERIARLYINDGLGNFTESLGTPFVGAWESAVAFADVNSDGHQDVLISGATDLGEAGTALYVNDGSGNFTEMSGTPFDEIWRSAMAFSDVNHDGYPDALIAGENNLGQRVAKLYTNDGLGNFTEVMNTPFDGVRFAALAFADVNNDGREDALIAGQNISGQIISKLYINDGNVSSTENLFNELIIDFILYPNPASDQLNIIYNSIENGEITIRVYGSNGQLLSLYKERVDIGAHTLTIDISSYAKGIYFIQLNDGQRTGTARFTIE